MFQCSRGNSTQSSCGKKGQLSGQHEIAILEPQRLPWVRQDTGSGWVPTPLSDDGFQRPFDKYPADGEPTNYASLRPHASDVQPFEHSIGVQIQKKSVLPGVFAGLNQKIRRFRRQPNLIRRQIGAIRPLYLLRYKPRPFFPLRSTRTQNLLPSILLPPRRLLF